MFIYLNIRITIVIHYLYFLFIEGKLYILGIIVMAFLPVVVTLLLHIDDLTR
jgi:hypothetical protein